MPLWQIYHPPQAFTAEEKKVIAESITEIYHGRFGMPKFYAVVLFTPTEEIFVGGEPHTKFVRAVISHIARESNRDPDKAKLTKDAVDRVLKPYVADRGYDWEFSYGDTPRLFWRINGMDPPEGGSEEEKMWESVNRPVPFGQYVQQ